MYFCVETIQYNLMAARVDFYQALRGLIDQIPQGWVSTPIDLADALGDRRAARAVSEALQRDELRDAAEKVVKSPPPVWKVFRDFSTDRPLLRLLEFQRVMSDRVVQEDRLSGAELIAGVDVAYAGDKAYAACIVLDDRFEVVDSASATIDVRFPYIPGYLAFREAPAVEAAAKRVSGFDVLLVNGHGVAHPRGCGLASHVGLDLEVPMIGVARRRLWGAVGAPRGDWTPLLHGDRVIGAKLSIGGRHPIYVSVGHNISLETSIGIVRRMVRRGRLPEPLREAHRAAEELRAKLGARRP